MSDLTITIAGVSATVQFTNVQADKFIPPLLRKHSWPGETIWANMTAQERLDTAAFVVTILLREAVAAARAQFRAEGRDTGSTASVADFDSVCEELLG